MRTPNALVLPLLLTLPAASLALPPPLGISLETAVSAAPGGGPLRLTAVTSCWLDGDLDAEARLGFGSARRPDGRAADALVPALGLRWAPDVGRWRPLAGVEAGVQLGEAARAPAPTASLRAGVELFARRELSLTVAAGWRWVSGGAGGVEGRVGLTYAP